MTDKITIFKLAIVGVLLSLVFACVIVGKTTFDSAIAATVALGSSLIVAFGIRGAGADMANANKLPPVTALLEHEPFKATPKNDRGFVKLGLLFVASAIAGVAALVFVACLPPKTEIAIGDGVEFAGCVLVTDGQDRAKGMSETATAEDILLKCGGTLQQIASVLDASKKRELLLRSSDAGAALLLIDGNGRK